MQYKERAVKNAIREAIWEGIVKALNYTKTENPYSLAEILEQKQSLLNEISNKTYRELEEKGLLTNNEIL